MPLRLPTSLQKLRVIAWTISTFNLPLKNASTFDINSINVVDHEEVKERLVEEVKELQFTVKTTEETPVEDIEV